MSFADNGGRERVRRKLGVPHCRGGSISAGSLTRESGRRGADLKNAPLRQMEATPHSGQGSHGRPTDSELKLADFEKLFRGRWNLLGGLSAAEAVPGPVTMRLLVSEMPGGELGTGYRGHLYVHERSP